MKLTGKGTVTIRPDKSLEDINSFTVEALVTPTALGRTQYLVDSQSPPSRIELRSDGTVVGSVHTEDGWESVDSGERKIGKKETASIRLVREEGGIFSLEINDRHANQKQTNNTLKSTGDKGITIGGDSTGKKYLFSGEVAGVRIRHGAVTGVTIDGYRNRAATLKTQLKDRLQFEGNLEVFVDPDAVDHRFDEIKAILSAAGVQDVSALATLTIDQPTTIEPNQVIIAPPKSTGPSISWVEAANILATATKEKAVELTATLMANRNSSVTLNQMLKLDESSKGKSGSDREGEVAELAKTDTQLLMLFR